MLNQFDSRKQAATVAGVRAEMLTRYSKGQNAPGFDAMARLAAAAGISLDWLATGRGEMLLADRGQQGEDEAINEALRIPDGELPRPSYRDIRECVTSIIYAMTMGDDYDAAKERAREGREIAKAVDTALQNQVRGILQDEGLLPPDQDDNADGNEPPPQGKAHRIP